MLSLPRSQWIGVHTDQPVSVRGAARAVALQSQRTVSPPDTEGYTSEQRRTLRTPTVGLGRQLNAQHRPEGHD